MNKLEMYKVSEKESVKNVIEYMEKNSIKAVFVMSDDEILKGLFTYGDMRKYFLQNGNLTSSIVEAMNPNPVVFYSIEEAKTVSKKNAMVVYPVIDMERHIIDALFEREKNSDDILVSNALEDVPLVIMAGGKGTRLYPYTKVLPKALIPIGDVTISEHIIQKFVKYGCRKVFFVLKHKGNMIKSYFNDLTREYEVDYVEETEFLGTGGGLSLLKGKVKSTFFVSNCDILVNGDLECALKTHKQQGNIITFICAMKDMVIPYGVVETDDKGQIVRMTEKPELSFLTNTGVYIVEPRVVEELKEGEFIHLPDIAKMYMDKGEHVGVFPISEKAWFDMGQFNEMENMMKELGV